ncbi:3872_t:CDS:2, partial [Entrophospora sp. SA101]
LQELLRTRPDLKGKSVYFFYKNNKFIEGILIYDKGENMSYVYDPTKPVTSSPSIASILRPSRQILYWSNNSTATILYVATSIKNKIKLNGKLAGTGLREIEQGLALNFFGSEGRVEKDMTIIWNANLILYEVNVLGKFVKNTDVLFPGVSAKRTLAEMEEVIEYVFDAKICRFEEVTHIRGPQLVNNKLGPNNSHEPFAFLENKGKPDEIYHHVDCCLLVDTKGACENCKKLKKTMLKIHDRSLAGTKSAIKKSNKIIETLQDHLKKKVEDEEEGVSEEMANIVEKVATDISNSTTDISSLNPIFQELIRIQCGKSKGTRYHPMFLRWAISVYSHGGNAAYSTLKGIMCLPSVSTLKSYINECEQKSGWQDKTAYQMLCSLSLENVWGYGQYGFFSHDSFKIQK